MEIWGPGLGGTVVVFGWGGTEVEIMNEVRKRGREKVGAVIVVRGWRVSMMITQPEGSRFSGFAS